MKMYISKNQVVKQGNVTTDKLVVHGQLIVAGKVKAQTVKGRGSIQARDIVAEKIKVKNLSAESLTALYVEADRIDAEHAKIKGYIYGRICLLVHHLKSRIAASPLLGCDKVEADECLVLPVRRYFWPRFRFSVLVHRILLKLHSGVRTKKKTERQQKAADDLRFAEYDAQLAQMMQLIEQQKKVIEELRQAAPQPSDSSDPAPTEPVVLRSAA